MNKLSNFTFKFLKNLVAIALVCVFFGSLYVLKDTNVTFWQIKLAILLGAGALACFFTYRSKLNTKYKLLIILAVAFVIRLIWIVSVRSVPVSDFLTMYDTAKGFLVGDKSSLRDYGYLARFPHLVPMMTYMMGMIKIFGPYHIIAMKCMSLILSVTTVYLIYVLSGYYVKKESSKLIAAIIATVFPPFISYSSTYCTETIGIPLFLLSVIMFHRAFNAEKKQPLHFLACGAVLYCSNMFRGVAIIFLIAFALYIFIFSNKNRINRIICVVSIIVGYFMVSVLASSVLMATDVIEQPLWKGKEPCYVTLMLKGSNFEHHGAWNAEDAEFVDRHLNDEDLTKKCFEVIGKRLSSKNPLEILGFYFSKFFTQWSLGDCSGTYWATLQTDTVFTYPIPQAFQFIYVVVILLSLCLFRSKEKHTPLAPLFLLLCGFGAAFIILETQGRYSYVVSWIFIILAACGLEKLKFKKLNLPDLKALYSKHKKTIYQLILIIASVIINVLLHYILYRKLHIWNAYSTIIAWILTIIAIYLIKKIYTSERKSFSFSEFRVEIIPFFKAKLLTGIIDFGIMFLFVDILFREATRIKLISDIIIILVILAIKTFKKANVLEILKTAKRNAVQFKETKKSRLVFIICAVFPFFMTDFILRYVINFIAVSDIKYYFVPILFNAFWIFGLVYLCYAVLPQLIGKILYTIIYLFFGILFLVNYVYFCIFGQYMWIKAVFLAGEGLDYTREALTHINKTVIFIIIIYIIFLITTLFLWKRPVYKKNYKRYIMAIIPFILLITLHAGILVDTKIQIDKGAWEVWERPVLVYKNFTDANKSLNVCGFYQFTFKSIYRSLTETSKYTKEEIQECDTYFAEKQEISGNEMTGILKDKNVVFVLMESMDDWLITEKYTPTIKYMMDNGINFANHYMPNMGSGYTFNSEFSMNTGFHCPTTSSSASVYTGNTFEFAMPNLFSQSGYNVNSFHFNGPEFYNRKTMHSQFGYSNYYCLMDYMPMDKCVLDSEVPLTDEVYKYMTEGKFFDFFISYSAHFPYDIIDNRVSGALEKYSNMIDYNLDEETRNAHILAHDTDEFFRVLIERLKEDGLYENTVIIGVTDHYAYGFKDKEKLEQYTKEFGGEIMEKVPFFIFAPGMEPQTVTKVTSAIDIVPTITNLFGLNSGYYLGNDAFDPEYPGFVYFSSGSWYDGTIHYKPGLDISSYGEENAEYITEMNKKIIHMMEINDRVVNADYFKNISE